MDPSTQGTFPLMGIECGSVERLKGIMWGCMSVGEGGAGFLMLVSGNSQGIQNLGGIPSAENAAPARDCRS